MRTSASKITISAVFVLALSSLAPVARAGTEAAPAMPTRTSHCVVRAEPAKPSAAAQPVAPRCFTTFAAAIDFATDGTVRLSPSAVEVSQAQLDAGRAHDRLTSTVIGIEYEDSGFGGRQWIISQASGCDDGGAEVWVRSDLTGTAMNNLISSARTYAGCKSRHFENASFGGSSYLCGCSQMGSMSDKTTSIRWSTTGF